MLLINIINLNITDKIFKTISEEFNVNGNICDVISVYIKYVNKLKGYVEKEYDSKFKDYRDINQDEKKNTSIINLVKYQ